MIYYQLLVCRKKKLQKKVILIIFLGEIVIWDEKDQGGYMIDNQGEWAKVGGHQWFRNNILKTCNKTSFTKR